MHLFECRYKDIRIKRPKIKFFEIIYHKFRSALARLQNVKSLTKAGHRLVWQDKQLKSLTISGFIRTPGNASSQQ